MKLKQHKQYVKQNGAVLNGYYIDETLYWNLRYLKKRVMNKWDSIGLLTGKEGTGKTTFAMMLAHTLDPSFNLDRIVFSGQELMKAIDSAKRGDAILFDEAVVSLSSQDFATDIQKVLIKKFTMIRSKSLIIFLVIPNFFMLRKYFAIDRCHYMINTYSPDGLRRGYFKFYSWNNKKKLYLNGMKHMDSNAAMPSFRGRFTDTEGFFIDPEAYEKKKQEAIKKLTDDGEDKESEKLAKELSILKERMDTNLNKVKEQYKEKWDKQIKKLKEMFEKKGDKYNKSVDKKLEKVERNYNELYTSFGKLLRYALDTFNDYQKELNREKINETEYTHTLRDLNILTENMKTTTTIMKNTK